jgi:hypothetical protein
MAWGTPLTAVANSPLNAAQWNSSVRDNLNETAAAKATTAGSHFAGTGVNTLAERLILDAIVDTSETTTSTSFVGLATAGPVVTITTGVKALVWINVSVANSSAGSGSIASFAVSGATTIASSDARAAYSDSPVANNSMRMGICSLPTLTAGSNIFTAQYRVQAGTGTFLRRHMQVMAL